MPNEESHPVISCTYNADSGLFQIDFHTPITCQIQDGHLHLTQVQAAALAVGISNAIQGKIQLEREKAGTTLQDKRRQEWTQAHPDWFVGKPFPGDPTPRLPGQILVAIDHGEVRFNNWPYAVIYDPPIRALPGGARRTHLFKATRRTLCGDYYQSYSRNSEVALCIRCQRRLKAMGFKP